MKIDCDICGGEGKREVYPDHSYCFKADCPTPWQPVNGTEERAQMNAPTTNSTVDLRSIST